MLSHADDDLVVSRAQHLGFAELSVDDAGPQSLADLGAEHLAQVSGAASAQRGAAVSCELFGFQQQEVHGGIRTSGVGADVARRSAPGGRRSGPSGAPGR